MKGMREQNDNKLEQFMKYHSNELVKTVWNTQYENFKLFICVHIIGAACTMCILHLSKTIANAKDVHK
jgi:hypothetical protein